MTEIKYFLTEDQKIGLKDYLLSHKINKTSDDWIYDTLINYVTSVSRQVDAIRNGEPLTSGPVRLHITIDDLSKETIEYKSDYIGTGIPYNMKVGEKLFNGLLDSYKLNNLIQVRIGYPHLPVFEEYIDTIISEAIGKLMMESFREDLIEEKKELNKVVDQ